MRIVQINSYSNGSTGHIANAIHEALLANGHNSLFAYGNGPDIPKGGYRIGSKTDFLCHTLVSLFTGLHGYSSVFSTLRLINKLKEFNPDIVHLHNLHGSYLNLDIILRYLSKHNVKTVITVHDCWIYTGKCYHYYEANCDRYLHHCGNCPQLSMYPKSYWFDFTAKMLKDKQQLLGAIQNLSVVTISDWLQNQVKKTFLGTRTVTTIRNGVSDMFRRDYNVHSTEMDERIAGKFVVLGVASSWNAHKGISDFIKLAGMLSDDEVIVLVGHLPKDIILPDNIFTIDHTSNAAALAGIYNNASVYVSMSTEETFGLTIAEALCCGLPTIVYQATACPEMVSDGENGYIALPHDVAQVYQYIRKIKNTSAFDKEQIAQSARRKYSTQQMTEEYLSFYKRRDV